VEAEQGRSHHAGVVDGGPVVEQLLYDVSVALPARPDERGRAILQGKWVHSHKLTFGFINSCHNPLQKEYLSKLELAYRFSL